MQAATVTFYERAILKVEWELLRNTGSSSLISSSSLQQLNTYYVKGLYGVAYHYLFQEAVIDCLPSSKENRIWQEVHIFFMNFMS